MLDIDNTDKEKQQLTNFYTPKSLHKKFKELCIREDVTMGDKLNEFISSFVKKHGEGNPNYELTKWEDPDFKMTPAHGESIVNKWNPFLDKCTEKELGEVINKSEAIIREAKKRLYEK